jgi:diacylglycerol kinase family enzyme
MMMPGIVQQSDCLVLVNPSAAAVDASVAHEIEGWLSGRARTVRAAWTEAPGHAAELVREHADAGLIIAVGGDGTVAELVQGMTGGQIVCTLPTGSGNSTARNLFGDRDWRQVLDLLDDPRAFTVRNIDRDADRHEQRRQRTVRQCARHHLRLAGRRGFTARDDAAGKARGEHAAKHDQQCPYR